MPGDTSSAATAALAPQASGRPSALAPLAPLPQRPPLEPVTLPPGRSLSKPRLPLNVPGATPLAPPAAPSAEPSPSSAPAPAAAEKAAAAAPPPPAPVVGAAGAAAPVTMGPGDAREPASLAGLASPVAGPAAPAAAARGPEAGAAGEPKQPAGPAEKPAQQQQQQPERPSQTNAPPAAAPQPPQPLALRSAEPTPVADAQPPPTLPGAIPATPKAEPQQASAFAPASAAAGTALSGPGAGARGGKREPPKEPPPATAVDHVSVTTDGRTVEQFIPFGFVELRNKLLSDFPAIFTDPEVAKKFVELCKWISLRNTLRLELDYGDADEKYSPLDPDKDTLAFKAAAAASAAGPGDDAKSSKGAAGGATPGRTSSAAVAPEPARSLVPKSDLKAMVADLYGELDRILDKAEFSELPPEDLENAKNHKSLMGLEVIPAPEELLEYRLHYRGSRTKKIQFRRWGLFKRQIEMNVYERLAVSFRLKRPVAEDDAPVEAGGGGMMGVDNRPWYRRLCGRRVSVAPALLELRDEFVYMKLFKDVLQSDVDMLLPGAVIKFTWFDYAMVWVPILVGCGMAIWKAVNGTIDFSNLVNAALSIVLIVMPITWGVRAYFAVKEKQRLHQAHLNAIYLLHNLNNNAGVIGQLLGEAQEQEDNETMLAYFFLWQGEASPRPTPKIELDRAVEAYLQRKLDELNVAVRMDYEVIDSVTKLERLGLLHASRGEDGVKRLQALPLNLALEKAHVRYFDESREAGQPEVHAAEARRQGSLALAWHECLDVFGPTGQKFRYFWNAQTGESQYHEPDEPYIKLGASVALDLDDAHGAHMSDPKKYPSPLHHAKTA